MNSKYDNESISSTISEYHVPVGTIMPSKIDQKCLASKPSKTLSDNYTEYRSLGRSGTYSLACSKFDHEMSKVDHNLDSHSEKDLENPLDNSKVDHNIDSHSEKDLDDPLDNLSVDFTNHLSLGQSQSYCGNTAEVQELVRIIDSQYRIKDISQDDNDYDLMRACASSLHPGLSPMSLRMRSEDNDYNRKQEGQSLYSMGFDLEDAARMHFYPKVGQTISTLLDDVLLENKYTNVVIIVESHRFNCLWEVLSSYCKYFHHEMLTRRVIDLENKVSAVGFDMAYQWMVTNKPVLQRDCIVDLYHTSIFLGIELLTQHCWALFGSGIYFMEDHAFVLYLECCKPDKDLQELRHQMLQCISKMFIPVVASAEFLNMPIDDLCSFLSSNKLAVNSEVEVLYAGVKWLLHDWPERMPHTLKVALCVRFKLLTPLILTKFNQSHELDIIKTMASFEIIQTAIRDAIQYSSILALHGTNPIECNKLLKHCELEVPQQRKWFQDFECSYHHSKYCMRNGSFSYDDFLKYLAFVGEAGATYWKSVGEPTKKIQYMKECCDRAQKRAIKH